MTVVRNGHKQDVVLDETFPLPYTPPLEDSGTEKRPEDRTVMVRGQGAGGEGARVWLGRVLEKGQGARQQAGPGKETPPFLHYQPGWGKQRDMVGFPGLDPPR